MPPLSFIPNLKFELRERGLKKPLKKGLLSIANRRVFAGADANNNIVVKAPKVPTKFLLIEPCGKERFYLYFTDQMNGVVVRGGSMFVLGDLISRGLATRSDGYYRVELDVNDEAKLQWGTTELWVKLTLPLPKEFKRKAGWNFELTYLIAFAFSLLLHSFLALYFSTRPPREEVVVMKIEETRIANFEPEMPMPTEETKPVEGTGPGTGGGKGGKGKGGKAGAPGPAQTGILAILTTQGKGKGAVQDLLQSGFDENVAKALGSVGGVQVATAGMGGTRGGGSGGEGGGPGTVNIGDLGSWGTAESGGLTEQETHRVKSDIQTPGPDVIGKLSRETIVSKVRTYMGGIRSCYEMELRLNPQLTGKVSIRFTIGADGRITDVEIINSTLGSTEVENCITRRIRRWEFPPPEEGEVVVTYPFVFTVVTQ